MFLHQFVLNLYANYTAHGKKGPLKENEKVKHGALSPKKGMGKTPCSGFEWSNDYLLLSPASTVAVLVWFSAGL